MKHSLSLHYKRKHSQFFPHIQPVWKEAWEYGDSPLEKMCGT